METSFCELKGKEVINIVDGKRLGKIIDIVFETRFGKVLGIVVPAYNKSWNIFKSSDDIFIPFNCICKFGEDAILVQIYIPNQNNASGKKGKLFKSACNDPYYNTKCLDVNSLGLETPNENTNQNDIVQNSSLNANYNLSQPEQAIHQTQNKSNAESLKDMQMYNSENKNVEYYNNQHKFESNVLDNTPPPLYPDMQ